MVASASNCYMMRKHELASGINVKDAEGNDHGISKAAATKAVQDTVVSRAALSVPVFGFPAVVMTLPPVTAVVARHPRLGLPISFSALMLAFGLGLPAAIAMSPQTGTIPVKSMEPEFQKLSLSELYYNKGL